MQPQTLTSPDAFITITSESTTTIDAQSPKGRPDWIIEFQPGGWHTHPQDLAAHFDLSPELAVDRFLDEIQTGKRSLWVRYHTDQPIECGPIDTESQTLDEFCDKEAKHLPIGERLIARSWSGTILRTLDGRNARRTVHPCAHQFRYRSHHSISGMIRFMNSSKSGTVNAVSP